MKIYDNQLTYLIDSCERAARFRGFSSTMFLPLEWRPAGGLSLLQQYACGDAFLDKSVNCALLRKFINAYGGYMDEDLNIKHSMIAMRAFGRLGR